MGAPLYNTKFIGNGSRRQAKSPITPQSGGLHDIYAKGQKLYGLAQTGYAMYQTYQRLRPFIQAGLAL